MKQLTKDTRIALLMGGPGSERDVSIASGNGVLEALRSEGVLNELHRRPFIAELNKAAAGLLAAAA